MPTLINPFSTMLLDTNFKYMSTILPSNDYSMNYVSWKSPKSWSFYVWVLWGITRFNFSNKAWAPTYIKIYCICSTQYQFMSISLWFLYKNIDITRHDDMSMIFIMYSILTLKSMLQHMICKELWGNGPCVSFQQTVWQ